ncbi:hypothetical protein [Telmatospirillum sp.]|uniref:hypothetical protein n=1 Tax=Telmatospirillum sp. TaxID=2079197 RepID=UPI00284E00CD|nr:hypothetical protein [Telmatospirillum sp.]MDR3436385.1 hypothetical protein [Telmatospirillum sp.]
MITLYAIQHKPTGFFLPEPGGRMGRGGSHVEPTDPDIKVPRTFPTKRGAQNALAMWLKGKFVASRGVSEDHEGNRDYYENLEVIPQPNRKREEMAVVPMQLVEKVNLP